MSCPHTWREINSIKAQTGDQSAKIQVCRELCVLKGTASHEPSVGWPIREQKHTELHYEEHHQLVKGGNSSLFCPGESYLEHWVQSGIHCLWNMHMLEWVQRRAEERRRDWRIWHMERGWEHAAWRSGDSGVILSLSNKYPIGGIKNLEPDSSWWIG